MNQSELFYVRPASTDVRMTNGMLGFDGEFEIFNWHFQTKKARAYISTARLPDGWYGCVNFMFPTHGRGGWGGAFETEDEAIADAKATMLRQLERCDEKESPTKAELIALVEAFA